ncbi:MAG: hypothetical protein ACK4M3_06610 [Pyrobaculum sp.]
MRLKTPFLRLALTNSNIELELENVMVFGEVRRGQLYAEIYIGEASYIYERRRWYVYDGEGRPRAMTEDDRSQLRQLAKMLSSLPPYLVLEKLIKALSY